MAKRRHTNWDMSNLGIGRAFACILGAASLVGAGIGWVLGLLTHHLLNEGRSDHPRSLRG